MKLLQSGLLGAGWPAGAEVKGQVLVAERFDGRPAGATQTAVIGGTGQTPPAAPGPRGYFLLAKLCRPV
jgi:hypothetical protein